MFKFAKPEHREQLLIDSGFRCHLTSFARATAAAPSPFVARLRKFLRTRRVTAVSQIGTDRIIDIQFSDGQYHLYLEFYAGGNIVLTDNELTVIALLRNVSEGAEHEQYRVGVKYNLSLRQNYGGVPPLTKERVREGLQKAVQRQDEGVSQGKKIKKKAGDALRKALAVSITEYPPVLLDHALQKQGFDKNTLPAEVLEKEDLLDNLMSVFDEAGRVMAEITSADVAKGYIIAKKSGAQVGTRAEVAADQDASEAESAGLMYDDFHPFRPCQLDGKVDTTFLEFSGFNKTVDKFFSSIEGQKLESKLQEREDNARRKMDQARHEHEKRIGGLQEVQELNVQKAQAIEANLDRVEEAAAALNGLIAQGMDWVEIGRLIEMEQSRHNPVAELIKLPLKLQENTATLLLASWSQEEEDELAEVTDSEPSDSDEDATPARARPAEDKRLAVDIDLALSGWSNARQYYDQRKVAATKQDKTQQASAKALKSTEAKITADLRKGLKQEKQVLRPVRKQMWFEKFVYFISSDGYLVLGGKDAQQNEILYRRYLKKGDIYVHADLHGAASVIIKNNPATPEAPVPPSTLSQAGNLSVCTSSAWDSKAVMSAWWVNADQVSKTAPTGEYLTTGGFMVRGKKNFLPPAQLLLGFAVLFQISEESKARHVKHRLRDASPESVPTSQDATKAQNVDEEAYDDDFPGAAKVIAVDADDEFPDAGADESDDEFPDAGNDTASASESETEQNRRGANPLQPRGHVEHEQTDGSVVEGDRSEDEHDEAPHAEIPAENGASASAANEETSGVRHLSAKERRQRKKGGEYSGQQNNDTGEETTDGEPSTSVKAASTSTKPSQAPRGKRGKAKKAAQKYAGQDDEDRRIAMELLGSRAAETKAETESSEAAAKAESAEQQRARRRAQHEQAQREGLEAEEIRRLNLDEGVQDLDEEEAAAMTSLDNLVATPLPGDEILEAIPVCAPWSALGKYKYKAKLQPGAAKKGKAVREVLGRWTKDAADTKRVDSSAQDTERIWPREGELIKAWKEAEIIGVVPVSKVRVLMSGGGGADGKGKGSGGRGGKGGGRGGKGSKKTR